MYVTLVGCPVAHFVMTTSNYSATRQRRGKPGVPPRSSAESQSILQGLALGPRVGLDLILVGAAGGSAVGSAGSPFPRKVSPRWVLRTF